MVLKLKRFILIALVIFAIPVAVLFALPQKLVVPVKGATSGDWNPDSFWHYPWGKSVVHKGIDIFAQKGTPVIAASEGLVWYSGEFARGGKVVIILGQKIRFHYYAHLNSIFVRKGQWVKRGQEIGSVGNTGNAAGKPPHLHYAIVAWFPHYWRRDTSMMGHLKMFYLDPGKELAGK
jgi:peptidoglycan LD-endopeptidase LytH